MRTLDEILITECLKGQWRRRATLSFFRTFGIYDALSFNLQIKDAFTVYLFLSCGLVVFDSVLSHTCLEDGCIRNRIALFFGYRGLSDNMWKCIFAAESQL